MGNLQAGAAILCTSLAFAGMITGWALTRGMTPGKRLGGRALGALVGVVIYYVIAPLLVMQWFSGLVELRPTPTVAPSYVPPTDTYIPATDTYIRPTLGQRPPAAPVGNLLPRDCIRWDRVQQKDVGSHLCVFGLVVSLRKDAGCFTIAFSKNWNDFKIQDWNYTYPDLKTGMCISVVGKVVDNKSFMMLLPDKGKDSGTWYSDISICK